MYITKSIFFFKHSNCESNPRLKILHNVSIQSLHITTLNYLALIYLNFVTMSLFLKALLANF